MRWYNIKVLSTLYFLQWSTLPCLESPPAAVWSSCSWSCSLVGQQCSPALSVDCQHCKPEHREGKLDIDMYMYSYYNHRNYIWACLYICVLQFVGQIDSGLNIASFAGPTFSVLCHRSIRKNTGGIGETKKERRKGLRKSRACLAKSRDGRQVVDKWKWMWAVTSWAWPGRATTQCRLSPKSCSIIDSRPESSLETS